MCSNKRRKLHGKLYNNVLFIQTNILVYDMLINFKVCSEKFIEQLLVGLPIVTRIEGFYEEVGGKL